MTDKQLIELGKRLLEVHRKKAELTIESKRINRELTEYLNELGKTRVKRGGMTFSVVSTYVGVDLEYLKSIGVDMKKVTHRIPCNPWVNVSKTSRKSK